MENKNIVNGNKTDKPKKYTWYPENSDTFYDVYDSLEDCIETAKSEYEHQIGEFYGVDYRYSPVIVIGEVEEIDYEKIVNDCFDNLIETINVSVDDFAFGTDSETECYCKTEQDEIEVKDKLQDIIRKHFYLNPDRKCLSYKQKYDLAFNCWLNEDDKVPF